MRNKLKYVSSFIIVAVVLACCAKKVDLNPTYTVNGDASFNTVDDYQAALLGAYARLKSADYYGTGGLEPDGYVTLPDMLSDNLFETTESLANFTTLQRWAYTADNTNIENIWLAGYQVIQQANLVMRNIDKLAAANPGAVNRIKGQAIALRAHAHFDLLRWFGEDYNRNSTKLGVPYIEVYDIEQKPARLTVKQTLDKIEGDLKTAKALLSNTDQPIQSLTSTAGTARPYIDTLVVDAMLARMYNYSAVSDSAIKYASIAINARPLASAASFPLIWQDASTAEVIWSVKFESINSSIGASVFYSVGNRASYRPTTNLLNLYDQVNDVRYASYFRNLLRGTSRTTTPARLVVIKYDAKQASVSKPDGIVDFKAFRTGEMYLIRAEAYALKGNNVSALADLNALRTARGTAVGVETGAALMTAIFTERRKELVAEGHRFFDLKRTTRTINRTTNCTNFCTLPSTAREWAFPIPQKEIDANPGIIQNPGY
jgi:starch-binding outer membrane protein, SusD/RagB family